MSQGRYYVAITRDRGGAALILPICEAGLAVILGEKRHCRGWAELSWWCQRNVLTRDMRCHGVYRPKLGAHGAMPEMACAGYR